MVITLIIAGDSIAIPYINVSGHWTVVLGGKRKEEIINQAMVKEDIGLISINATNNTMHEEGGASDSASKFSKYAVVVLVVVRRKE